jgi:serine/threonine-protein kinase
MRGLVDAVGDGPSLDPLVGRVIDGRFRIEERLGSGGMGVVYRGLQESVDRQVALKLLHPTLHGDAALVRRFLVEMKATSALNHPHIVTVYDSGRTEDGLLYIAIEFLDGRTLSALLEDEGPIHPRRALGIAIQACDALGAAHGKGIVHRDIKPSNLMLVRVGENADFLKILDFGVAKLAPSLAPQLITQSGAILGTLAYMAPEAIHGEIVGEPADLYSLGVVLHEMLAGRRPFDPGTGAPNVLGRLLGPPPPLDGLGVGARLERALDATLNKALAIAPEDRFQTAADMKAELVTLLEQCQTQQVARRSSNSRPADRLSAAPTADWHSGSSLQGTTLVTGEAPVERTQNRNKVVAAVAALAMISAALGLVIWAPWNDEGPAAQRSARAEPPPAADLRVTVALPRPVEPASGLPPEPSVAAAARPSRPATATAHDDNVIATPSTHPLGAVREKARASVGSVALRFRAEPSQVAVYRGQARIGLTPFELRLPVSEVRERFVFRKSGFVRRTKLVVANQSQVVFVRLRKLASPPPASAASPPQSAPRAPGEFEF